MPGSSNVNVQPAEVVTPLAGYQLLGDSFLNKGTAFTEPERDEFELHGLLPSRVASLDEQVSRRLQALRGFSTDLGALRRSCASFRTPTKRCSTRC
jgi:malate dehydrogenase (oxaloacetate-decarboxylating)